MLCLSVLLYDSETGTIGQTMQGRLNAVETVLFRVGTDQNLMKIMVNEKIRFLSDTLRKVKTEDFILTGIISGRRTPCRQRHAYLKCVR